MTYALTLASVAKHKPCDGALNRLSAILPKRKKLNAAQARELGAAYEDIIWIASAIAMDDDDIARRLTGYLNDCAKRVLHIWERRVSNDEQPRKSIQATDDWLDGKISEGDWKEAARAARAAWGVRDAWDARDTRAARAAWGAWDAWTARTACDAWNAWASWTAREARAAWAVGGARDAFYDWQFVRLVYWLTEQEPVRLPTPDVEGLS